MDARLAPGDRVGPYEIQNLIGSGGMGAVFKARDTRLGRTVAIKTSSAEWSRRVQNEARASAALNHPHICSLHDVGEEDGVGYLVMEYVEGQTLSSRLRESPLRWDEVWRFGAQIADALSAAHAQGIVHRDLKPGNIMLTDPASRESCVKVLDFGLAKFQARRESEETLTASNAVLGTLEYMAPEQLEGKPCDARSDIYALGLVLYEMGTGRKAFAEILHGGPVSIPGAPPIFTHIVRRCTERDPARRWQSATDVKLELESAVATIEQTQEHAAPAGRNRLLRRSAIAAGAAVVLWIATVQFVSEPHAADLAAYRLTPFATSLAVQADPAWSPDGKSIAFMDAVENYQANLYVQGLGAPTPAQITHAPFTVFAWFRPFWSQDSQSVYFSVRYSPHHDMGGIWRVSAAGGEPVLVQTGAFSGAISPDGRTLAMFAPIDKTSETIWLASPPESPRRRYQPTPFINTALVSHRYMAFSPDGRKLLAACSNGMWLLPWPAGKSRRVLDNAGLGTPHFAWLPDSRHIAAGTGTHLVIADVETGAVFPVLSADHAIPSITAAKDGATLAYQSSLTHVDVIAAPLDGGPVVTLLGGSRDESQAACSPVAAQIVYVTNQRGSSEIWIKSLTEGWSRPLLTASEYPRSIGGRYGLPVFSPDGQRIAFSAVTEQGASKVFVSQVFNGNPTPVRASATAERGAESRPTWSPDGNWLSYGTFSVSKTRLGAQEPPVVLLPGQPAPEDSAHAGSWVIGPEWSPTGEWIACLWNHTALVSPDGKQKRELCEQTGPSAWSRDGGTLYQIRGERTATLVAIDIANGRERFVRDLGDLVPYPNNNVRLSLTSDGKSVVYPVRRPREEIWLLDGFPLPKSWWRRLWPR